MSNNELAEYLYGLYACYISHKNWILTINNYGHINEIYKLADIYSAYAAVGKNYIGINIGNLLEAIKLNINYKIPFIINPHDTSDKCPTIAVRFSLDNYDFIVCDGDILEIDDLTEYEKENIKFAQVLNLI